MPRRLLVATTNPGKLTEIRSALAGLPLHLLTLADVPPRPEPDESGTTFAENARLKALYYAGPVDAATVAEDSGLEIDALDGEPGVRSARFLGADASYPSRFAEIERRLAARAADGRAARFVCALALVVDGKVVYETTGTIEGLIAATPAGDNGFGYDPIFYYPAFEATLAQVSGDAKLAVSHRGRAFRHLAGWMRHQGWV